MLVGVVITLAFSEPNVEFSRPECFRKEVIDPFVEFLTRPGAVYFLLFVALPGILLPVKLRSTYRLSVGTDRGKTGRSGAGAALR